VRRVSEFAPPRTSCVPISEKFSATRLPGWIVHSFCSTFFFSLPRPSIYLFNQTSGSRSLVLSLPCCATPVFDSGLA
jgi:hypothetical protein